MGDQIIMFVSQIFNGLKIGSVYSLVALGYTMVYGIIRLINFAHGDFIMVGAYVLMLTIPAIVAFGLPHGWPSFLQSSCAWRWASSWRGPHTSRCVRRATA